MKSLIEKMYGITFKAMIKIAPLVYKLKTERGNYILKYISNPDVDNIYSRLSMLRLDNFSVPIKMYTVTILPSMKISTLRSMIIMKMKR